MSVFDWGVLLLCGLTTCCALIFLRSYAADWGLIDHPSKTKLHRSKTPLIGGLAVAIGILSSLIVALPMSSVNSAFLVGAAVVVFVGMLDDIYDVSVRVRFIGQALAASVVLVSGETSILSLGDLLGFGDVHLGLLAGPFTLIAMVGVMNAFNMVDGIDGFLGVSSLVCVIGFTLLSWLAGNDIMMLVGAVFIVALIPYLVCNLIPSGHPNKVFMGDAGSLLMGFSLSWLLIVGSQPHLSTPTVLDPITALYLAAVPLIDILTVMARRVKQKRSPVLGDHQHIHHLFGKAGISNRNTLVWLTLIMAFTATLGVVTQLLLVAEWIRAVMFIGLVLLYILLTKLLKKRMTKFQV